MTDESKDASPGEAWFGYRRVARREKTALVRDLFSGVAARYDLMNDLMSGGIHRLWKAAMVGQLAPRDGEAILDLAGGTGDIAFRLLAAAPEAEIAVCDLTPAMLEAGRARWIDANRGEAATWICGDAQRLPFPEMRFDACAIAFGLRNVADAGAALAEAHRVLKPGGRFLCLEFSRLGLPLLERLYDLYSFRILPWLGETVAGSRDSYLYLAESIRRFPGQEALAGLMGEAGFRRVRYRNFSGGVACLHSGWRV